MGERPPLPEPGERWAFFLDVDGTLLAIAPTPEEARPEPRLLPLLARLQREAEGALALVSGRRLASIDALFAPLQLPAAGLHGWERRLGDGTFVPRHEPTALLQRLRSRLAAYAAARPGLLLEDKGGSLALHYRLVPQRGPALLRLARRLAVAEPALRIIAGRKVVEFQPRGADKGQAILAFLEEPPFAGRRPVFAGDDVTDEDAFAAVNRGGGLGVKVCDGETRTRATAAHFQLEGVPALHHWLEEVAERLTLNHGVAPNGASRFHPPASEDAALGRGPR
jgi:trehalose 6-phosphate phosphatase